MFIRDKGPTLGPPRSAAALRTATIPVSAAKSSLAVSGPTPTKDPTRSSSPPSAAALSSIATSRRPGSDRSSTPGNRNHPLLRPPPPGRNRQRAGPQALRMCLRSFRWRGGPRGDDRPARGSSAGLGDGLGSWGQVVERGSGQPWHGGCFFRSRLARCPVRARARTARNRSEVPAAAASRSIRAMRSAAFVCAWFCFGSMRENTSGS